MPFSSDIAEAMSPVYAPLPRNVYSYVDPVLRERVYVAVTSAGALLNDEIRRRAPDETESMIVRELWLDLDRQDAVIDRPQLCLYVSGVRRSPLPGAGVW